MLKLSTKCAILGAVVILQHFLLAAQTADFSTTTEELLEATTTSSTNAVTEALSLATPKNDINKQYCEASLCRLFNGTHVVQVPHIACANNGTFAPTCGAKPHLLYMSERRRNFILDMHNLARARIASGKLEGYKPASHMPVLKWDNELEYLATLHVKRCEFAHDKCHNTPRFRFSGQNIGYYWIGREFKSHSKRIKSFILNWFREYRSANQTFIDHYYPHANKKIGHFTMLASDRAHRVGCAAVRFRDDIFSTKFLMTCNYDFTNVLGEPVYQSGPTASKCVYKNSEKFSDLCDWQNPAYNYESEERVDDDNLLGNSIEM